MSKARNRYKVLDRIGMGGMATVHLARERQEHGTERLVAIKRLLPHLAEDEDFVRSFVREAKLASHLDHPNIVELYRLGKVGHDYFICMEYIDGHDLRQILKQAHVAAGPPPIGVALSLLCELLDALDHAHTRCDSRGRPMGLIHRDISPANLLVNGAGRLKIIDFGVAKATSKNTQTQTGLVKGKFAYMAPEAIHGETLDARSDIFSAGIVAHELLTARPLFASRNDYHTIQRIQNAEVLPPSTYNSVCPPELDDIVLKALARDPEERWQSAAEMRDALREIRAQHQPHDTAQDVREWIALAFSLDATKRRRRRPGSGARLWTQAPQRLAAGTPSGPQPLGVVHDDVVLDSDDEDIDTLVFSRVSPEDLNEPEAEVAADGEPEPEAVAEPDPGLEEAAIDEAVAELAAAVDAAAEDAEADEVPLLSRPVVDLTGPAPKVEDLGDEEALSNGAEPSRRMPTEELGAAMIERERRHRRNAIAFIAVVGLVIAGVALYPRDRRQAAFDRSSDNNSVGAVRQDKTANKRQRAAVKPTFAPIASEPASSAEPAPKPKPEPEPEPETPPPASEAKADATPEVQERPKRRRSKKRRKLRSKQGSNATSNPPSSVTSGTGSLSFGAVAPPPAPVKSRGPVLVAPSAVKKVSGSLPRLSVRVPDRLGRISAKLCIDARGAVRSARILTPVSAPISRPLRASLKRWRYAPFKRAGTAVPACFAVSFRVAN